ncbi:SDR family NAD(P)-dependent oxidoreductase [Avibacterium sp. 21-586]|uniref:SDR family NAD(P)-dependent oxidoreductase n=1 Tax=Avibacterium sp. 21-586 TaxID=2911534 RepID=UPI00224654B2|nr:SDR family NAD(P)-dependent oxidoreductase [Avibacterium sp. 21-586]MCW9709967.1 SDR family NAD(P)-dependent oxidoreductase [Avibacterium sp. 21-586]
MRSVAIVGLGWLGFSLGRHLKNLGWVVKGSKRIQSDVEQMRLMRLEAYRLMLDPEIDSEPEDLSALLTVDCLVINIPPSQYFFNVKDYILGIKNLVNEALNHGVQHFIFVSSTSVFPMKSGYFDEQQIPQPDGEIGRGLLEIEQWLAMLPNIDCDIIRFAGLIGLARHPVYSLAGKTHLPHGNTPVNLVHLDDCVRAIELLLDTPCGHRLYHLSAPNHPKKKDYYTNVAKKLALIVPHFVCLESDPIRIIEGNKISQELGFVYQYPDPNLMIPIN